LEPDGKFGVIEASGYATSAVVLMSEVVSYGYVQRRLGNLKGLLDIAIQASPP
jgi:hypothetical protein